MDCHRAPPASRDYAGPPSSAKTLARFFITPFMALDSSLYNLINSPNPKLSDPCTHDMDVTRTPANMLKGRPLNQIDRGRRDEKRSYRPDQQRDPRDQSRDRYDYDDSKFIPWM